MILNKMHVPYPVWYMQAPWILSILLDEKFRSLNSTISIQ